MAALALAGVLVLSLCACGGSSSGTTPKATPTITLPPGKAGLLVTPEPVPGHEVLSMQLVAPGKGWALTKERLAWTSDGGATWRDITPPGADPTKLMGTFFLDAQHGWTTTIDHTQAMQDAPSTVDIYRTSDGGMT